MFCANSNGTILFTFWDLICVEEAGTRVSLKRIVVCCQLSIVDCIPIHATYLCPGEKSMLVTNCICSGGKCMFANARLG